MPRLRALEPDGTEHFVPQPTSEEAVLRLAQVVYAAEVEAKPAAQAPAAAAAAAPGEGGGEAEASYAMAVESLLKARAELEPMLDIIAHLETNEHVSIVEVQRPSAKVEALISDLAVRAQSKYSEIESASDTLRRASAALRMSAERSHRFFAELAELQHAARLLPAPDAANVRASFVFDVSFPGLQASPAEVHVLVGPSDTGSVSTVGVQPPAEGVDRVREVIRAKKASHLHSALTRHLREEVGAISSTDPTGILAALEAELQVALKARSEGAELSPMARAWLRLTDSFFMEVLAWTAAGGAAAPSGGGGARSEPPRVLPRVLAHLQHAASARRTHALLAETVNELRSGTGAPGLPLVLLRHNTGDPLVSAWELSSPGLPPVSIVLRGAEAHIEGVRTDESLDLPAAGIKVTPSWLPFWVADSLCKHVLNALRRSAAAAGVEVASGRRHVRTVGGKRPVRIAGCATQQGGITWEVTTDAGAAIAVPSKKGASIVDALAGLMR